MKSKSLTLFLVALAIFTPAIAAAGEIRGILTKEGKPVADAKVKITAGTQTYSATTDKYGFYRVFVPEKGKVNLLVEIGQQQVSAVSVNSFGRFVQCDLVLEGKNGNYTLKTR